MYLFCVHDPYIYVFSGGYIHAVIHAWMSEDNLQNSVVSIIPQLGIELRSSGFTASTFIYVAISPLFLQYADFISFDYRPSSGAVRSYGSSIFNF